MDILIGVDRDDAVGDEPIVQLVNRLRFSDGRTTVTHAVAPDDSGYADLSASVFVAPAVQQQFYDEAYDRAERLANRVAEDLRESRGMPFAVVLTGNPAKVMMDHADAAHVDIIGVNSSRQRTAVGALLTGSITRALVIGASQSVIIAHRPSGDGMVERSGPVRAVLATDHSSYANRCVERLAEFAPAGIEHLAVMTAYPETRLHHLGTLVGEIAVDPARAVREMLAERNEVVIDVLRNHLPASTSFSSHIVNAPVHEAIARTMAETQSDLLILGANGHSFIERTLLGSVSFAEAVTRRPYSVFILRSPSDPPAAEPQSCPAHAGKWVNEAMEICCCA